MTHTELNNLKWWIDEEVHTKEINKQLHALVDAEIARTDSVPVRVSVSKGVDIVAEYTKLMGVGFSERQAVQLLNTVNDFTRITCERSIP